MFSYFVNHQASTLFFTIPAISSKDITACFQTVVIIKKKLLDYSSAVSVSGTIISTSFQTVLVIKQAYVNSIPAVSGTYISACFRLCKLSNIR